MQKAIIGKKVGMTQIFDETGKVIPVTVVEAGPCVVTQKKIWVMPTFLPMIAFCILVFSFIIGYWLTRKHWELLCQHDPSARCQTVRAAVFFVVT